MLIYLCRLIVSAHVCVSMLGCVWALWRSECCSEVSSVWSNVCMSEVSKAVSSVLVNTGLVVDTCQEI